MTLEEFYGYLLTHEQHLEQLHSIIIDALHPTANARTNNPNNNVSHGRCQRSNNGYSTNSSHSSSESRGRSRGKGSSHGVLGPPPSSRSRPTCQVCHNIGHSALDCYHRYDHAYQSSSNNQITSLVYVGNGQGLKIYHRSSSSLPYQQSKFFFQ